MWGKGFRLGVLKLRKTLYEAHSLAILNRIDKILMSSARLGRGRGEIWPIQRTEEVVTNSGISYRISMIGVLLLIKKERDLI